jgi:hypothetical protein
MPKSAHQRVRPREQDVLRLDVAVDHPFAVGVLQRVGRLAGDPERVLDRELDLALEPVAQALAPDERHGEPEQRRGPGDRHFARVEHREDVGMLQPRGQPDLALEPLVPQRGGQLPVEHLEGDRAVVPEVLRQEHRGHAAAAELAVEGVAAAQAFLELCAQVCQMGAGGEGV